MSDAAETVAAPLAAARDAAASEPALLRTPLHPEHMRAGARMVPFAGWQMPVQYAGVLAEHRAVRTHAGLFDVSHMGQLVVEGHGAEAALQRLLSNDLRRIPKVGQAQYTLLTNDRGGIEDDLIVYRRGQECFLLVVNASNRDHDRAWMQERLGTGLLRDESDAWAMLALQGPAALDVLYERCGADVRRTPAFMHCQAEIAGAPVLVATTGYTGERGCELMLPGAAAVDVWQMLLEDDRVVPAGLGARDTLRLEACYPLHGSDITSDTNAVEAGLGWACGWETDFVGRDALAAVRAQGPARRLVPLRATGRGIPRAGCDVLAGDVLVGTVTSGTMSPMLGIGIALAYVAVGHGAAGTDLEVDVRGRRVPVQVAQRPLYPAAGAD